MSAVVAAAPSKMTFKSVAEMFLHRVAATPERAAYMRPTASGWETLTWKQVGDEVRAIACGLKALGLQPEQRVAIASATRLDWVLADMGIMCAAGATTTVYPSTTPDDEAYILNDSQTQILFAENDEQVQKILGKRGELKTLKQVVTFDGKPTEDGFVISLAALKEKGKAWEKDNPGKYEEDIKAVRADQLATLIYTSGTTGRPKGVELIHDCWVYEGEAIDALGILGPDDVQYLWLPLAHSMGKVLEAAQIRIGFMSAVDGRIDKLVENLAVIRPTFVAAVPRIFEKVHNKVIQGAKEGGGAKWAIFQWAMGVGRQVSALKLAGKQPGGLLAMKYKVADKLVFSKLKARFGGRVRFFISGAAPLSRDIAHFFHAAGILILEGYGLTETSAFSFVNRPDKFKFGTVGLPAAGTEVKIDPADGEILIRGRGVMRGYHNLPEQTAETITADRWLRTGDIGEIDADGFLRITDRKKDLIKTSGGKYVAPQAIEGKLKASCPFIAQAVVHGDNRNYCTALITLDEESIKKWAAENGLSGKSYTELAKEPKVKELIQGYVDQVNAGLGSWETIKKFSILPQDFSEAGGELTPSLKVKRKFVEKKYKDVLDAMYPAGG